MFLADTRIWITLLMLCFFCCYSQEKPIDDVVVKQITATGKAVREAFKNGDLETIKLHHHPDVVKALSYNNLRVGREAVLEALNETMAQFDLEFIGEKEDELFLHKGDLVIKQILFGIRLIPKNGDDPFVFRGRTLVILQRYDKSPTGWATIHEIIQPFEE